MTQFEPVHERVRRFGTNGYFEVGRRRLREETGETEFLVVSRGTIAADGTRRWMKFVTVPDDPDLRAWLAEALREV